MLRVVVVHVSEVRLRTLLNRGNQRGLLFIPQMNMSMERHGGRISTGETPDLSIRVVRYFYLQSHLVATQEEHGE
jgi:hypothetical protein